MRGGALCVAGPGETSLTRISPRIRQLQDRLMDSLPCDGAWECLSPAQREAILSIHRMRTACTDESSEHGEGGKGHRKGRGHGIPRFVRSRSYDDRLESETDDSGVRGVNGTSSGATSHNSHEDDSSDPGVKRGGRFAKAVSADRATRRDAKNEFHEMNNMKNVRKSEVTNGFGNVNKIISKQMNKASAMPAGPSNITLDCRNVQGEKRRRSRIDVNGPFREGSAERNLEAEPPRRAAPGSDSQQTRIGLTRRNILSETFESDSKLHSLKELKETASSEEYDSGVNFKNDDSMDEYVRDRQNGGCDFNNEFESDRTPRSDATSPSLQRKRDRSTDRLRAKGDDLTARKASAERDPFGGWDRDDKNRSREREVRSALASTHPERPKSTKPNGEPLKSNMKVGYGAKLNSSFDYRTNLNQDQMNKYSSNWNNMILNNDVPIKPSNAAVLTPQAAGREARFAKNGSSGALVRSTGNLANKSAVVAQVKKADPNNWMLAVDPRRTPNPSQERPAANKKYVRSKSLDRKYLDEDTSEEESDFETRRRTDRVRRYQRANQDWEVGRPQGGDERGRQRLRESDSPRKPKAKSAWDLSGQSRNVRDDFDEFEEVGFRTRSDFRNRWQSEDSDVTRHRKTSENSEFGRMQWNRRSCDFDLDFPGEDLDRKSGDKDFDRKRWYRRSCDLDLDFDLHQNRQRREVEFDTEWGRQTLENCDDFEPELAKGKGKRSRSRIAEQQLVSMEAPGKGKGRGDDKRRGDDEKGRRTRAEIESGRMTRLDDVDDRRLRLDDEPVRRVRMEDDGRRTRLEEHYRSKTSMGHYGREKRERSRTPHLLRENGVLSFENPNYTLGGSNDPRLDDALNSNNSNGSATHDPPLDGGLAALDELYTELDHVCNLTRTSSVRNRRNYAHLDIGSMGVDVATGPVTNLDQADHQNNSLLDNEGIMGRKQGLSYSINQPDLIEHVIQRNNLQQQPNNQIATDNQDNQDERESDDKCMLTPEGGEAGIDSGIVTDGGSTSSSNSSHQGHHSPTHIPHMTAGHTQDLYALPVKRPAAQTGSQNSTPTHQPAQTENHTEKTDPPIEDTLPPGWEKHEDNDGPYYWHIKSGTITRTPPEPTDTVTAAPLRAERRHKESSDQTSSSVAGTVTRSNTSSALSELSDSRPRTAAVDNAYKRRSYPARSDITEGSGGRPIRFAVRSLGWVEIAEEDLTPERSSKAVNRCIVDLSVGRRDVLDVVGCWGDGKDLFMDLDEGSLKLVDPENLTVLNTQPIHTIRVWGVGRDNGRDFAYVARDRVSRKHMCHVFRCDTPARTIANTLRDICKKIMIERSLQQNMNKPLDTSASSGGGTGRLTRPTNLPTEHRRVHRHPQIIPAQSFPTPMEEPKKVMRVEYVGMLQVERPSGMETINTAIDRVAEENPRPWKQVSVAVAPSTVTVTNTDDGKQIAECRVRYLSFLGIGRDVRHCAFIMHTAQDQFIAYVFYCEPSTGALCKTIEAACKLRYQKCLDAHPGVSRGRGAGTPRSISSTLRSMFGSITGRKARSAES